MNELLNNLYNFVISTSKKYNIDESHSLGHSMKVFYYSKQIYENEILKNPYLEEHKSIIYISSILHDMCDKKYMDENIGSERIRNKLEKEKINNDEIEIILKIILNMSYSKIKINGYPNLGKYTLAFHIVREADLLAAYEFERCIIYQMMKKNTDYIESINFAKKLFDTRMLKHIEDELFITDYSKQLSLKLHNETLNYINNIVCKF